MSVQNQFLSLSKEINIYTDEYIKSVPYLNTVHKLLKGDNLEISTNNTLENIFSSMQRVVGSTNINLPLTQLAVIFNRTIRMKGQIESVSYFFSSFGIQVQISINSADSSIMFAIIDFGKVEILDLTEFELAYQALINELLLFGSGDYIYEYLEYSFDFVKTVSTEITYGYSNIICISSNKISIGE